MDSGHVTKGLALPTIFTFDAIKKKKLNNNHLTVAMLKDPSFPSMMEDYILSFYI